MGRRGWWVEGAVLAALVAGAGFLVVDHFGIAREDHLSSGVRTILTTRVRDVLEADGQACAVHVLGTEPRAVAEAAKARTVYVWALCGTKDGWVSSVPVVVRLTAVPAVVVPEDEHRGFPKRLWGVLDNDQDRFGLEPQLRRRLQQR